MTSQTELYTFLYFCKKWYTQNVAIECATARHSENGRNTLKRHQ